MRVQLRMVRHKQAEKIGQVIQRREPEFFTTFLKEVEKATLIGKVKRADMLTAHIQPNTDTAPVIEDFSQNVAFQQAAAEKPWCDYGTEFGSPGVDRNGLSYTSGRSSIFCDGLHDGLCMCCELYDPLFI